MFGKPHWFREKRIGWGLSPKSWQGWLYVAVWLAILLGPFFALLSLTKLPEAMIWLVVSTCLLVWDARNIVRQIQAVAAEEDIFVIDEDTDVTRLTTEKYEFQLRDR